MTANTPVVPSSAVARVAARFPVFEGSPREAGGFVMLAVVTAMIVAVGRNRSFDGRALDEFILFSAFAAMVAFASVAILRLGASWLGQKSIMTGSALCLGLLGLLTVLAAELLVWSLNAIGLVAERWPEWHGGFVTRSLIVAGMVGALGLYFLILKNRTEHAQESEREATLQALQSRIRPHFLFNSLNSVAGLTRADPARAEMMLQDLADLFRVLLMDARKLVPLSAEREITRQYLEIEKIRLGDRLSVRWDAPDLPRSALIPSLTLQPLVENAIYHGIEPSMKGGEVVISIRAAGTALMVEVANPLPESQGPARSRGNKIAQENIRARLHAHYGANAGMEILNNDGYYRVRLRMPLIQGN